MESDYVWLRSIIMCEYYLRFRRFHIVEPHSFFYLFQIVEPHYCMSPVSFMQGVCPHKWETDTQRSLRCGSRAANKDNKHMYENVDQNVHTRRAIRKFVIFIVVGTHLTTRMSNINRRKMIHAAIYSELTEENITFLILTSSHSLLL